MNSAILWKATSTAESVLKDIWTFLLPTKHVTGTEITGTVATAGFLDLWFLLKAAEINIITLTMDEMSVLCERVMNPEMTITQLCRSPQLYSVLAAKGPDIPNERWQICIMH